MLMACEEDKTRSEESTLLGRLLEAANFAAIKHRDQRRKDPYKTPYINHPLGVAHILWKEGGVADLATLQAALLHDTLEDTDTEETELAATFGEEVAAIVKECSDDKGLAKWQRKKKQIEAAPRKSRKAKLVSLADKLHNLRDLDRSPPSSWDPGRTQLYFIWSAQVLSGLRGTSEPLETLLEQLLNKRGVSMATPDPETSCQAWKQYGD